MLLGGRLCGDHKEDTPGLAPPTPILTQGLKFGAQLNSSSHAAKEEQRKRIRPRPALVLNNKMGFWNVLIWVNRFIVTVDHIAQLMAAFLTVIKKKRQRQRARP